MNIVEIRSQNKTFVYLVYYFEFEELKHENILTWVLWRIPTFH
jgi:hypothetical protein